MVDKQIKLLLHQHDCVVIPEFGGLIARYVPARIHPVKHTFVPPSKKIAFNEKLILNDGLLISAIAHSTGISQKEAQRQVAAFVVQAREKLQADNRFLLQDIGIFRYNAARKLEFEFVESENLLDASFGLPEIIARPIKAEVPAVLRTLVKERQEQAVATKQPLRRRLKRIYNVTAGLFLGGLTITAFYLLSLQTDYNLSSLNPISLFGIGNNTGSQQAYSRFAADYVPLTSQERAAIYQETLPLVPGQEQSSVLAWQSFAAGLRATEAADAFDPWAESEAAAGAPDEAFVLEEEAQPVVESAPATAPGQPAVAAATNAADAFIIKGKTGRAYVITGGYSTLENAEQSREQIRKQGYEPLILLPGPGSRLFRVAVADFATEAEAHAVKRDYRKIFGETIWVLNN